MFVICFLSREGLFLSGLAEVFETLVLVSLSEAANSVWSLVFGPLFLVVVCFVFLVRFESILKSGSESNVKNFFL